VPVAGTTGPALRVPTSGNLAVGQNAVLSFSGTAGQQLSFNVLNSAIGSSATACLFTLYDPNNHEIGYTYCGTGGSGFLDQVKLTTTGTYTVSIDPQGTATGSLSVSINNDQDVSEPIVINGAGVSFSTIAGENANITFSNPQSQSVTVHWSSGTYLNTFGCNALVTGPSPSTNEVGSGQCNTTNGTMSLGTLASGSYNILIDPQQQSAGGMTLTATSP
jgi:hypothetical protein